MATSSVNLDEDRGPKIVAITVPIAVLSVVAVADRFFSRHLKNTQLAANDYLVILGLVLSLGCCVLSIFRKKAASSTSHLWRAHCLPITVCIVARMGVGKHIEAVPPEQVTLIFKIRYSRALSKLILIALGDFCV